MTVPVMPNPTAGNLAPNVQNTGAMSNPQQASGRFGDAILAYSQVNCRYLAA